MKMYESIKIDKKKVKSKKIDEIYVNLHNFLFFKMFVFINKVHVRISLIFEHT